MQIVICLRKCETSQNRKAEIYLDGMAAILKNLHNSVADPLAIGIKFGKSVQNLMLMTVKSWNSKPEAKF